MGEDSFRSKMTDKYPFFATACVVYAVFLIVCLYKNGSGITFPVWAAGTCFFAVLMMKKADVPIKRASIFYIAVVCLLGLSTCMTGDKRIIAMNKWMIFFMMMMFLLTNFYDTDRWSPIKFIANMFCTLTVSLGCMERPFADRVVYVKGLPKEENIPKKRIFKFVLIGLAICVPLVAVILVLLANADAIFARQLEKFFENFSLWSVMGNIFKISFIGFNVFMASYIWFSWLGKRKFAEVREGRNTGEPLIAITVMAVLSIVYIFFCWIQVRYLFVGGISKDSLPEGVIYSTYARTGFFQLLAVSVINTLLVMVAIYCFRESRVLKALLCVITACTYIMIASSAMRMLMYIQYKYLTFLRIYVLFALIVIALVLAGVMVNIFYKKFRLFRYGAAVLAVCYVIFSFTRPDYWIAKVNTDNMKAETKYEFFKDAPLYDDLYFLEDELGTDAAPVLWENENVPEKVGNVYKNRMKKTVEDMNIRSLNFSWYFVWDHYTD